MIAGTLLRNRLTLIVGLAFLFTLFLVFGAARKGGHASRKQDGAVQRQSSNPRVQNKTRSFELTQARGNRGIGAAGGAELSLRNGYDKNITAFAVSVNGLMSLPDFVYSENLDRRAIAPGAIYTSGFGSVRRSVDRVFSVGEDSEIKILAVLFDDKTSDGDEKPVAFILEQRLKSKLLLTRIAKLLDEDLNFRRTIDDGLFDELRSRISSFSNDPADSSDINDVLRWLDQSDPSLSLRKRILRVQKTCENLVARL